MAHAYMANSEWAARDFGYGCFSAPDQETKNEALLALRCAGSLSARAAWSMCARQPICASDRHAIEGGACDDRN
eukprot:5100548-Prymnesium_polylepis.1